MDIGKIIRLLNVKQSHHRVVAIVGDRAVDVVDVRNDSDLDEPVVALILAEQEPEGGEEEGSELESVPEEGDGEEESAPVLPQGRRSRRSHRKGPE